MERYQDLQIDHPSSSFNEIVAQIETKLPSNWLRDKSAESRVASVSLGPARSVCFRQDGNEPYHPALLWLKARDEHSSYVSNIVPGGVQSQLSYSEYNSILRQFFAEALTPLQGRQGFSASLTDETLRISEYVRDNTATKLSQFSNLANKSTGSSHPNDFDRWCDFIVSCHKEQSALDGHVLGRWLHESEGWPENIAIGLVSEYEFARDLLKFYDNQHD